MKKTDILALVVRINDRCGNKHKSTYHADYNSVYGGWRLYEDTPGFINCGAFGRSSMAPRMSTKVFHAYLSGLVDALTYKQ